MSLGRNCLYPLSNLGGPQVFIIFIFCLFVLMCVCVCLGVHMEVRRQLAGIISLIPVWILGLRLTLVSSFTNRVTVLPAGGPKDF